MTQVLMLDDVNLTIEAAKVTSSVKAIAGYVNGTYKNWPAIVAKWGKANLHLLSIDVAGNAALGAQCLDVEKGDVDPTNYAAIIAWVRSTQAAGKIAKDLRYYPKVYTSVSNAAAIISELAKAGIARNEYLLWTAHYTGKAHICSSACGFGNLTADATQYTDKYDGVSLDASLCEDYFFAGAPMVTAVVEVVVPNVIGKRNTDAVAALTAVGLKAGSEAAIAGVVNSQTPGPGANAAKGATVNLGVKADPPKPAPAPAPAPVPAPAPAPVPAPAPEPEVIDEPKPEPALAEVVFVERVLQVAATLTRVGNSDVELPAGTVIYIPLKSGA